MDTPALGGFLIRAIQIGTLDAWGGRAQRRSRLRMQMAATVFFSWQADTSTGTGRNFLSKALEEAREAIASALQRRRWWRTRRPPRRRQDRARRDASACSGAAAALAGELREFFRPLRAP